jgi:hypothetical protein
MISKFVGALMSVFGIIKANPTNMTFNNCIIKIEMLGKKQHGNSILGEGSSLTCHKNSCSLGEIDHPLNRGRPNAKSAG